MGDIAEMMIDGTMDFETGEYLGPGPGYPRTFNHSLPWEQKRFNKPGAKSGRQYYWDAKSLITSVTGNNAGNHCKQIVERYDREVLKLAVEKNAFDPHFTISKFIGKDKKSRKAFVTWLKEKYQNN